MNETINKRNNFIYILVTFFVSFFFADRFMVVGIVLLAVTFIMLSGHQLILLKDKFLTFLILMAVISLICFVLQIIPGYSKIIVQYMVRKEIFRAIIYAVLFEILLISCIDITTYMAIWRIIVFIIVGIAILQFIKVFDIDSILQNIYGTSGQYYNTQFSDLSSFRCGSVFVNPNVLASFLVAALASYLCLRRYVFESVILKIISIAMIIIGLVLTGSRTGMISGIIVMIFFIILDSEGNLANILKKVFSLLLGLLVLLLIAWFSGNNLSNVGAFRMFQVSAGTQNSLQIKFDVFIDLLKNMNALNLLFGYGPFDYTNNISLAVDFDFGYFLTYFGIFGLIAYLLLIRAILYFGDTSLEGRRMLNKLLIVIVILFGITAGVYFNLRIFAIYLLMFMPKITVQDDVIA